MSIVIYVLLATGLSSPRSISQTPQKAFEYNIFALRSNAKLSVNGWCLTNSPRCRHFRLRPKMPLSSTHGRIPSIVLLTSMQQTIWTSLSLGDGGQLGLALNVDGARLSVTAVTLVANASLLTVTVATRRTVVSESFSIFRNPPLSLQG